MVAQLSYNTDLRADITTHVGGNPKARVHSVEWRKIQAGDPVEINPSVGFGYKVATPGLPGTVEVVTLTTTCSSPIRSLQQRPVYKRFYHASVYTTFFQPPPNAGQVPAGISLPPSQC